MTIQMDAVYGPSEDVVAREVEGELIIVPLAAGIGDMEDELYTLNDTARAIWNQLDGTKDVRTIVAALTDEYDAPTAELERDVLGLVEELFTRKMLVQVAAVH